MIIPFADMNHPYIDLLESQGKRNNIEIPFKNTYREQPMVSRAMFKDQDTWYVSVDDVAESNDASHVLPIMGRGGLKHFEFWYPNRKLSRLHQPNVRRQDHDEPKLGTGLLLVRSGLDGDLEILLSRRSKGPLSYVNRLSPYGGAVDRGESVWGACTREMREEMGIDLETFSSHPSLIRIPPITEIELDNGDQYHAISMPYALVVSRDFTYTNMEAHKHTDDGWYSLRHLSPRDMTPLTNKLLRSLRFSKPLTGGNIQLQLSEVAGTFY